jgi:hypothetical protein
MDDWRKENAEHLRGLHLKRKAWYPNRKGWDHDHCEACMSKLSNTDSPEIQKEGYATCADYKHGADYGWVCVSCFNDLRAAMGWIEQAP